MKSGVKSATMYASTVTITANMVEHGQRVMARATTSMREGHMPMWNEVLQLPESAPWTSFDVALDVYVIHQKMCFENDWKAVHQFSVGLTTPIQMKNGYCDEWIEMLSGIDLFNSCTSPDLRHSVRLHIACSHSLNIMTNLQKGIRSFKKSSEGKVLCIRPGCDDIRVGLLRSGRNSPLQFSRSARV